MNAPTYRPTPSDEWLQALRHTLEQRPELSTVGIGGTVLLAVTSS